MEDRSSGDGRSVERTDASAAGVERETTERSGGPGGTVAVPVTWLGEVDSTNSEAMRRARAGERGPLWIVADRQTGGRGRNGRVWRSPPGNLYASLLFEPGCPPGAVHQLSLLAGVAVVDALVSLAPGLPVRLKWPNDVLVEGAKIAGILAESLQQGSGSPLAVVGIGIDLAAAPEGLERPVTSLAAHGAAIDPRTAFAALAGALSRTLAQWHCGDAFDAVRAAWLARAGSLGERMTIDRGAGPIPGFFAGLDEGGALLLEDGGCIVRYTYGDVTLCAEAETPAEAEPTGVARPAK
jgi:BirA family biotin operon repressor/biotin-[acetyl-CoA-carboxylase] ligase